MSGLRGTFSLPRNAIAPRVGAALFLSVHVFLVAVALWSFLDGSATWITAASLVLNGGCAWFRMWQLDWLTQVRRYEKRVEDEKPPISPKLFMPYSTCPKCNVEALHWIISTEVTDFPAYFKRVCDFNKVPPSWYRGQDVELIAREWAAKRAKNIDVIRECRDCGHTWGQKVGQS